MTPPAALRRRRAVSPHLGHITDHQLARIDQLLATVELENERRDDEFHMAPSELSGLNF